MNEFTEEAKVPMIEMKGIKKYFTISSGLFARNSQDVKAVDDITLTINKGEIVGLVGESGSGKTTLARVILNLTKPTESTVYIDGIDIAKARGKVLKKIRRNIAVVFQDPASNLNPRQTVESSIMRPMRLHGVPEKTARAKAKKAMELVKMDEHYLHSYPHQLSGGQLQRIAIARALVLEPEVMILDEPTSALDISVQAQILNLLIDLQETLNLTYLVITHDLNVIRYISDRVVVMYLGKMMEFGPTEEIIKEPKHPYTQGLVAASPILDPRLRDVEKKLMGGDPGSLVNLSQGCRFSPRCPQAMERCHSSQPDNYLVGPQHEVACFLWDHI